MHECAQVRQLQISHVMNQFFGGHAEFSFGGFLFYVGVPENNLGYADTNNTAASFLPGSHSRRRNRNESFLKVFCDSIIKLGIVVPRSAAPATLFRAQGVGGNRAKLDS